jgi:hypothetical protein
VAGVNAGALPAFLWVLSGGGHGLFRIAMEEVSGRREAYRSYEGGGGLPDFLGFFDLGVESGAMARRISACNRGMKPESMDVPPITKIEEAIVFRRSTGT